MDRTIRSEQTALSVGEQDCSFLYFPQVRAAEPRETDSGAGHLRHKNLLKSLAGDVVDFYGAILF